MKLKIPKTPSVHMRDMRGRGRAAGGGGGGLPLPAGKVGLPVLLIILVVGALMGGRSIINSGGESGFNIDNPLDSLQESGQANGAGGIPAAEDPDRGQLLFFSAVFDDVQGYWDESFRNTGSQYTFSEIRPFEQAVDTDCGNATDAVGPFYCPADQGVYFDLDFMDELGTRFGAPGDFAQAYVVAHEVGHHLQNLSGINREVSQLQQQDPDRANELSVRLELQADCLAGVWGHNANQRGVLEAGDLEEGLAAAAAVGDDRLQQQATGRVQVETFTHGSSDQRVEWFSRGFESGDASQCDTFSGDY
jgi:predicted metalloprotease